MDDTPNEKKFMREKIVKPPVSRRRILRRVLAGVLFAAIFGAVAAASFVLSRPMAERMFGKETVPPTIPITIEKDDDPSVQTAPVETMVETTAAEIPSEAVREEVEKYVDRALEDFPWSVENLKGLGELVAGIGQNADKSVVTVSSVRQQTDWFDNPVETTGQYAGMILAVNRNEIVILTTEAALEEADELRITFGDGTQAQGTVKQKDTVAKMAAVSVDAASLGETTKGWIRPVELGNSYSVRAGDLTVAVGGPAGPVHSVLHGTIPYVAKGVQVTDGQTRVLYVDMDCSIEKGTFFLNLSGQLIGWATDQFSSENEAGATLAMAVSEYKGTLQKLINGTQMPYFGVRLREVSPSMQEQGIPSGVYITDSLADGPAYQAGIQNGDILTMFGEKQVTSLREFTDCLESAQSGDQVEVAVQRKGIDEYKEIRYTVTIGAR